jgi:hypothetical protein
VLACGKSNNAEKFKTRGIVFDQSQYAYVIDPTFDLEKWRADVAGKSKGVNTPSVTEKDIVIALQDAEKTHPAGVPTGVLVEAVCEITGSAERTVKRAISVAVDAGYVIRDMRGKYTVGFREA